MKTLATESELEAEQDKTVKLQMHGLSYFLGDLLLVIMASKYAFLSTNA